MMPVYDTRRHPLDYWETAQMEMPEPVRSPYRGLVWLLVLAGGVVWFYGTVMIIKFLVAG
jgi:hypothetical protein